MISGTRTFAVDSAGCNDGPSRSDRVLGVDASSSLPHSSAISEQVVCDVAGVSSFWRGQRRQGSLLPGGLLGLQRCLVVQ